MQLRRGGENDDNSQGHKLLSCKYIIYPLGFWDGSWDCLEIISRQLAMEIPHHHV